MFIKKGRKKRAIGSLEDKKWGYDLLDFRFAKVNVFADNRIVFAFNKLLGHFPRIFLCHIKIACIS